MKAERVGLKVKFVPVIVTLESQEEVDAFYTIGNHQQICKTLPALDSLWKTILPFASKNLTHLWNKLDTVIRY